MIDLKIPDSRQIGDVTILDLSGNVTGPRKAFELRGAIDSVHARGGSLLLNLKDVTRLDSAALGEIIRGFHALDHAVGIYQANSKINEVFRITKLDTVINVSNDEQTALTLVTSRVPLRKVIENPQLPTGTATTLNRTASPV